MRLQARSETNREARKKKSLKIRDNDFHVSSTVTMKHVKKNICWAARIMSVGLSRDGKTNQSQMFPVLKVQRGVSHQTQVLKARVDATLSSVCLDLPVLPNLGVDRNLSCVCLDLPFLTVTSSRPSVTQELSASPTTSGPK